MKFARLYTFPLFEVWHDERDILKPHMSRTDLSKSNWLCVYIRYRRSLFIIHYLVYNYTAVAGLIANGFCGFFFQRTKRWEPQIDHTLPADTQSLTCFSWRQYFSALYQLTLWNGHECEKKTKVVRISRRPSSEQIDGSKTTGEYGIFQMFG
jgi:hypothetical protein